MKMTDIYSVNEAAAKLGLSPNQVRYLLGRGNIEGKKFGRDWMVLSLDYQRKRKPKRKKGEGNETTGIPKTVS